MVRPDGWVGNRATFAKKVLWVVKDKDEGNGGRMWPAGKYVPQTRVEPEDSIRGWVKGDESIENEDIVLFITVGVTHIPRPEDWPVMPVEHVNLLFKPRHFFATNPSMDVPGSKDPASVPAFPAGRDTRPQIEDQPCCT
jgi:primary-amine oxidase